MLYMVVETFADGRLRDIYKRLADEGRMMPEGLDYVNSWITDDLAQCFQVMRTEDRALLDKWLANWKGYMTAEVYPVVTSPEAAERATG